MNAEDAAVIKTATDALFQEIQKIGAAAYQQSGPAAGEPAPGGDEPGGPQTGPPDDNVVDGEFRNE
jgi:hypothetical protein